MAAALVASVSIAALGACSHNVHYDPYLGEDSKSPNRILQDALSQFSSFYSVRERGTETLEGVTVNTDLVAGKERGGGTISLGTARLNLVLQGTDVYVKADAATWSQLGYRGQALNLADRWIHTTADVEPFAEFVAKLDLSRIDFERGPLGIVVREPRTTINGIPVIPLRSSGLGLTVYVRDGGEPTVIASTDTGASGVITFDQYDTAEPPGAPKGATDLDSVPTVQQQ